MIALATGLWVIQAGSGGEMNQSSIAPIRRLLPVGLLLLSGCFVAGRSDVDQELTDLRLQAEQASFASMPTPSFPALPASDKTTVNASAALTAAGSLPANGVKQVGYFAPVKEDKPVTPPDRIPVPPGLPGADAPKIPEVKGTLTVPANQKKIDEFYPPTTPLPPEPLLAPGPEGHPMTLADLQRIGATYSPAIKNALAAVEAAKGVAFQAGMYPNPIFSFENDTIQTGPAGYPGFQIEQSIKTGGKLKLQQAAALMDVLNAKAALRRAQTDLFASIRGYYFAVLVARENVRISGALFRFAEEIYRYQVEILKAGLAQPTAFYEPLQLRPLVLAARLSLIQARLQALASWRQLAASLGLPDMPPSELAGRIDMPLPVFDFEQIKAVAFRNHTDVITAENNVRKAKYNLELARLVPLPDVYARLLVQKDYTTPPNQIAASVQVGVPIPVWDQNKGGIRQAEAQLAQALVGPDQARNALAVLLADAINRYELGRAQIEIAQQQIADQLRAYKAMRIRRNADPTNVVFNDLVTAQQTLAGYITGYVAALGGQWQAVVDVANVLQTDDLYGGAPVHEPLRIPDLNDLNITHQKHGYPPLGPECAEATIIGVRWTVSHPTTSVIVPGLTHDTPPAPPEPCK
jgi:cobalt-zinc-cadmium efflux system outer membrane protein